MSGPRSRDKKDAFIRWWFCQGTYAAENGPPTSFMLALFASEPNENMLLFSVLPPGADEHVAISRVDAGYVARSREYFESSDRRRESVNVDNSMAAAICNELIEYGPPAPVQLQDRPRWRTDGAFEVDWGDISFRWVDEQIDLSFVDPLSGEPGTLRMTMEAPLADLRALGAPTLQRSTYATCPAMSLSGTVGDRRVAGQAWFDHQKVAVTEWFIQDSTPEDDAFDAWRFIGWEWLGAVLDDGERVMVLAHRDMQTRDVLNAFAIRFREGEAPRVGLNPTATALRDWVSPASAIRYPVAWRFAHAGLGIDLTFEPAVDAQEFPVIGHMRAIWEGAGGVAGTVDGRAVAGRARLELMGYGYLFNFNQFVEPFAEWITEEMELFLPRRMDTQTLETFVGPAVWRHDPDTVTEALCVPVWDLLDRGGKHWRPTFGALLLETLGVSSTPYRAPIANVIELIHDASLVIDDIEDDSLIRRNEECLHLRYGVPTAINAGNTLYFLPQALLRLNDYGLSDAQLLEIHRIYFAFCTRAHMGQAQDILWSKNLSPAWLSGRIDNGFPEQILQMYCMKTAAASEGMAELVSVIAQVDPEVREACASFGRISGTAFQIVDDVLNFNDAAHWTKTQGEDLQCGKPTYVIVRALERLEGAERARLTDILCDEALRNDDATLAEGIDLVKRSGALAACQREALELMDAEWKRFSQHVPPSQAKTGIRTLFSGLFEIDYDF